LTRQPTLKGEDRQCDSSLLRTAKRFFAGALESSECSACKCIKELLIEHVRKRNATPPPPSPDCGEQPRRAAPPGPPSQPVPVCLGARATVRCVRGTGAALCRSDLLMGLARSPCGRRCAGPSTCSRRATTSWWVFPRAVCVCRSLHESDVSVTRTSPVHL